MRVKAGIYSGQTPTKGRLILRQGRGRHGTPSTNCRSPETRRTRTFQTIWNTVRITVVPVRWLGLCGRILGIALIGAVLAGVGFGLTRPVTSTLPPCLSYVHTTKCLQPGAYVNGISFPPLVVGAILAAIWLTQAILLLRGWLHPDPDWI